MAASLPRVEFLVGVEPTFSSITALQLRTLHRYRNIGGKCRIRTYAPNKGRLQFSKLAHYHSANFPKEEREGFEPPHVYRSPVFKAGALPDSAISPLYH